MQSHPDTNYPELASDSSSARSMSQAIVPLTVTNGIISKATYTFVTHNNKFADSHSSLWRKKSLEQLMEPRIVLYFLLMFIMKDSMNSQMKRFTGQGLGCWEACC
jgi:hypothetical protein